MDKQNEKAKKNEMTELTPEQMGKVSGGAGKKPRAPGQKTYVFDDYEYPDGSSQAASSQGSSAPVTQTVSTPTAGTNCDAGKTFRKLNWIKIAGEAVYVFDDYETDL